MSSWITRHLLFVSSAIAIRTWEDEDETDKKGKHEGDSSTPNVVEKKKIRKKKTIELILDRVATHLTLDTPTR